MELGDGKLQNLSLNLRQITTVSLSPELDEGVKDGLFIEADFDKLNLINKLNYE